jgi:hypothetical protein
MAASVFGCSPVIREARFRNIELTPVSYEDTVTVADLQVVGTRKVIGVAKGTVTASYQRENLYVEALETALASAPSGADVLVAPSTYEVTENKTDMTVTIVGYPARYKNFRKEAQREDTLPFSVRLLPGGETVLSYDRNEFTAKLTGNGVVAVQAVRKDDPAATATPTTTIQDGE